MSSAQQTPTETLFHQWRKGDATAGQEMAQRFTDWYFAIAASRFGEEQGDGAFRSACTTFSRGVGKVTDARRLLGWAHNIARKSIHDLGETGRLPDGDLANAFSRKHSPKDLLVRAREHLPAEMHVLEHAYLGHGDTEPRDILDARYELKAWLREHFDLPFRVVPRPADPDRAPLPLYEAGRLRGEVEDTHFELYMLHDMEVCQDVAEFAHFAIALRGGLPGTIPSADAARPTRGSAPTIERIPSPTMEVPPDAALDGGRPALPPTQRPTAPAGSSTGVPPTLLYGAGAVAVLLILVLLVLVYVSGG